MSRSIYVHLAVYLIKLDIEREDRAWRRAVRKTAYQIPWDNPHLLRDIGLTEDGYPIGETNVLVSDVCRARRRVMRMRRRWQMRIPT